MDEATESSPEVAQSNNQSINQSISFNETKNRLKVPADTAAAGTVQWHS